MRLAANDHHKNEEAAQGGVEKAMVKAEARIVAAAIAVFVALAGIMVALHGLVFDRQAALDYGALAVLIGVASFAVLLMPMPEDHA